MAGLQATAEQVATKADILKAKTDLGMWLVALRVIQINVLLVLSVLLRKP
jgi:hypothetical protein